MLRTNKTAELLSGIPKRGHAIWLLILAIIALGYLSCHNPNTRHAPNQSASIECQQYRGFVHVPTDELTTHATHEEEPDSPLLKNAGVHATVVVRVFVDDRGEVICANVIGDTNAFLADLSLKAAWAWHFRPLLQHEHPTGMQSDLVFHIDR